MPDFVIEGAEPVALPVSDSAKVFPVNQLFCVGRNYADHAIEMGHDPNREPPFFFMKPTWSVLPGGGQMVYPAMTSNLHFEVELVVAIGKGGINVSAEEAMGLVYGFAVGIDFTRRDLQDEAKEKSRPWEASKSFRHAAPIGSIRPIEAVNDITQGAISLLVNGEVRQQGDLNQMIWKIPQVISRLSELFVLNPGDLIFTGTPAGVGRVQPGDALQATVDGLETLDVQIGAPQQSKNNA